MLATPAVVLGDSLSQFSLATPTSSIAPVPALHTEERGRTSRVKQEGELEMLPRSESKIRTLVGAIGRAMSRDRRAEDASESRGRQSSSTSSIGRNTSQTSTNTPPRSLSRSRPPQAPSSIHSIQTHSTASVHFAGRGGMGNTIRSPSRTREQLLLEEESEEENVVIAARERKEERSRSRSRSREVVAPVGRGGRGNMRSASRQPNEKEAQKEREEIEKEREIRDKMRIQAAAQDTVINYGRGGAGNLKVRRGSES